MAETDTLCWSGQAPIKFFCSVLIPQHLELIMNIELLTLAYHLRHRINPCAYDKPIQKRRR